MSLKHPGRVLDAPAHVHEDRPQADIGADEAWIEPGRPEMVTREAAAQAKQWAAGAQEGGFVLAVSLAGDDRLRLGDGRPFVPPERKVALRPVSPAACRSAPQAARCSPTGLEQAPRSPPARASAAAPGCWGGTGEPLAWTDR